MENLVSCNEKLICFKKTREYREKRETKQKQNKFNQEKTKTFGLRETEGFEKSRILTRKNTKNKSKRKSEDGDGREWNTSGTEWLDEKNRSDHTRNGSIV